MASVMAIISKSVFEQMTKGQNPAAGKVVPTDRYSSTNPRLESVKGGAGSLFLVTVRPPNEVLWLVAVIEKPAFKAGAWIASKNTIAITDITALKGKLKFDSGTGIQAKAGALAMSLQTPRILTPADEQILLAACGRGTETATAAPGDKAVSKTTAAGKTKKAEPVARTPPPPAPRVEPITAWVQLGPQRQARFARFVERASHGDMVFLRNHGFTSCSVPVFLHTPTGLNFHLIVGGRATIGLSDTEVTFLREQMKGRPEARRTEAFVNDPAYRPVRTIDVPSFLLAERPFTREELSALLFQERTRHTREIAALRRMNTATYAMRAATVPGTLKASLLNGLEDSLAQVGLRLPSETEWEFAARTSGGAFVTGTQMPTVWTGHRNPFGLVDLGAEPELCADDWHPDLKKAPSSPSAWKTPGASSSRVVRGGAARIVPGSHDMAWTRMLCANRSEHVRFGDTLVLRPVWRGWL